jgi:hypothetical protein
LIVLDDASAGSHGFWPPTSCGCGGREPPARLEIDGVRPDVRDIAQPVAQLVHELSLHEAVEEPCENHGDQRADPEERDRDLAT